MLIIRTAEVDDAAAIATVHVDTWRAAYAGMIPQSYLDSLTVQVGSSRVDLQACKLEYSIVSPK